ncbi:hypothetical protein [Psychroflexus sp. ALD_RP9]|uniref:hypothetical protein n=1 Tax=Psychroflexus sp. ALD_RP9 TaxID=2777186 RepID=UPI001A90556F|nr:hypothetical protein [Psychroflexus sp. ALD_RP9]QSS96655.1 hypothetical protein IMZ30_09400 [Psychroflexus sp. ALD_RP9]
MDEIAVLTIFEIIFNFIGASFRWIFGNLWRTMTNKPKYAFKEYLNGAKKSTEYYDKLLHGTSNVIVGVVVTLLIILMVIML